MSKMLKSVATLGPVGYLPAPGTMGTIATLPLVYLFSCMAVDLQLLTIIFLLGCSYFVVDKALPYFNSCDPSQIILDEVIGTLVTFYGLNLSPCICIVGSILFRVFDIFKPCGISKLEKLPGAFGILADDVVAGIFAHVILRLLFS